MLLTGAVAGQGSPYLPAPHLESPHQAHGVGRLGGFLTASSPSPVPLTAWGKGPEFRFQLCCWVNLVVSQAL